MQSPLDQAKKLLQAFIARRRLFIVVAAIVAVGAVFYTFFIPKVYEAKSTVFIERNVIDSLMRGLTVSPSMSDRIRVLRYYMVSRDMVTRTLKELDMDSDPRYREPAQFEMLVRRMQEQTRINLRGQDLFIVSLVDPDPSFAKDYINTLVTTYVEENLSDKREESYGANRFLTEQVAHYKRELDEIEDKIHEFRKETGIYSTVTEASVMAQIEEDEAILKSINGRKTQAYATIKTIKEQIGMLRDGLSSSDLDTLADFGDPGAGGDYLIDQLQAQIDELLLVYNDQYPTVVKLRAQIEELKKRQEEQQPVAPPTFEPQNFNPVEDPIYVDLQMRLNTAQSDLNALIAEEKELLANIESNQQLLRNFPEDKQALNDLLRERSMQASVYNKLLERVGISEVSQQMEVADKSTTFRIVDPAITASVPVGKKRILLMLLGIAAGVAAGLGAVYIAEILDNSIRSTDDLQALEVTVLAEIPFIWSEADTRQVRRKDWTAFAFGTVCFALVGVMLMHDLLRWTFIDRLIS